MKKISYFLIGFIVLALNAFSQSSSSTLGDAQRLVDIPGTTLMYSAESTDDLILSLSNSIPHLNIVGALNADTDYTNFNDISELQFDKESGFTVNVNETNENSVKISLGSAWTELIPNFAGQELLPTYKGDWVGGYYNKGDVVKELTDPPTYWCALRDTTQPPLDPDMTDWYQLKNLKPIGEEILTIKTINAEENGTYWDYLETNKNKKTFYIGLKPSAEALEYIAGPKSFTNQAEIVTNYHAPSFEIKAAQGGNMNVIYDPTNSVFSLMADAGRQGPRGADGIGNIVWAGQFNAPMIISNENTWVSYNGSIWNYNTPSEYPIIDPPTNNANWTMVISHGENGKDGTDGEDGINLRFVEWTNTLTSIDTNMLLNYEGWLFRVTNNLPTQDQPIVIPVVDKQLVSPPYVCVVPPGKDGTQADVFTNATLVVNFDVNAPLPEHSLVVFNNYLWYREKPYTPGEGIPSFYDPDWMVLGKEGPPGTPGTPGMNGVNLRYAGAWIANRTNEINDLVRVIRQDGKIDWYRAIQWGVLPNPLNDPEENYWSKEITSGYNADVTYWTFLTGTYDSGRTHSNELYRAENGKVYYSKGIVPSGYNNSPYINQNNTWGLFVQDGTSIATNVLWKGTWTEEAVPYNYGDMVTYKLSSGANSLYICTSNNVTASPNDPLYWTIVVTGLIGQKGEKGEDGGVTYYTNIVNTTYLTNLVYTNIVNITNYQSSVVREYGSTYIYPEVTFNSRYFDYNPTNNSFELTDAALGVISLNQKNGNLKLSPGSGIAIDSTSSEDEILISFTNDIPKSTLLVDVNTQYVGSLNLDTNTLVVTNLDNTNYLTVVGGVGLSSIPIGLTTTSFDDYSTNETSRLIFDVNSGFKFYTNADTNIVITGLSSWTDIYDDLLNVKGPTGKEPIRITTHTNNNKVVWTNPVSMTITNESGVIETIDVPVLSIGTTGERGEPGANLVFYGLFDTNKTYPVDSLVRYDTNVWFSEVETTSTPGENNDWNVFLSDGRPSYVSVNTNVNKLSPDEKPYVDIETNEINKQDITLTFYLPQGEKGETGTIEVGDVITGDPGTDAAVTNTGTSIDAIFDFTIPRGYPGAGLAYNGQYQEGHSYLSNSLVRVNSDLWYADVDTTQTPSTNSTDWSSFLTTTRFNFLTNGIPLEPNANPEVTSSYDETNNIVTIQFSIPRGEIGVTKSPIAGSALTLNPIIDPETGEELLATAKVTTGTITDETVEFNFEIPGGLTGAQGPVGPAGTNAAMVVSNAVTVEPTSTTEFGQAYVHMTNEADNTYALYFGIPAGLQGEKGDKGDNGANLTPKGSWISTNTYYLDELVRYGNAQYYVINDNGGEGVYGIAPTMLGNTNWFVFVQDGEGLAVNATTLFAFDEQDEAIYYTTNILLDTNTLMVVTTNINDVEYSALTVVGGGSSKSSNRIISDIESEVLSTDSIIWMNGTAAETNQMLILPDMTSESQTIVVRQLGNDYFTSIKRIYNDVTNTYIISGDGDGVTIDWLGAITNWYWRTF